MFLRTKKVGDYVYLQIVENRRLGAKVSQRTVANLGRFDDLLSSGRFESLVGSALRFQKLGSVIEAEKQGRFFDAKRVSVGPDLIFGRLWADMGIREALNLLKPSHTVGFLLERAVYIQVLRSLMTREGYRLPSAWMRDFQAAGCSKIQETHLQATLRWLGELHGPGGIPVDRERRQKDLVEMHLAQNQRSPVQSLFVVLPSVGAHEELLGLVLDQEGVPLGAVFWPVAGKMEVRWSTRANELGIRFKTNEVHLVVEASVLPHQLHPDHLVRPHGRFSSVTVLDCSPAEQTLGMDAWLKMLNPKARTVCKTESRRVELQTLVDGNLEDLAPLGDVNSISCGLWWVDGAEYDRWLSGITNENTNQSGVTDDPSSLKYPTLVRVARFEGKRMPETNTRIFHAWRVASQGLSWMVGGIPSEVWADSDEEIRQGHLAREFLSLRLRLMLQDRLENSGSNLNNWPEILRTLSGLTVSVVERDGCVYRVREPADCRTSQIFKAVGVALPPKVQECSLEDFSPKPPMLGGIPNYPDARSCHA